MQPTPEELGLVSNVVEMLGGWFTTVLLSAGGIALSVVLMWYWITRAGKPQTDLPDDVIGRVGVATTQITRAAGRVDVNNQSLRALSNRILPQGTEIRVVEIDGMIAKVVPADEPWPPPSPHDTTKMGGPPPVVDVPDQLDEGEESQETDDAV